MIFNYLRKNKMRPSNLIRKSDSLQIFPKWITAKSLFERPILERFKVFSLPKSSKKTIENRKKLANIRRTTLLRIANIYSCLKLTSHLSFIRNTYRLRLHLHLQRIRTHKRQNTQAIHNTTAVFACSVCKRSVFLNANRSLFALRCSQTVLVRILFNYRGNWI